MWPSSIEWRALRFGVEIEFVGGRPAELEPLPGWRLVPGEAQTDEDGADSGGELVPPPLLWSERAQIREMVARLRAVGARANWACGLHVHVGLDPWGQSAVLPLVDAALACQDALRALVGTAEHRLRFCPPLTRDMRRAWTERPSADALRRPGRPASHRCGIHPASWYTYGTVEIRYANASLRYSEVARTVELCLRWVAAVGAGLPMATADAEALARAVGAPRYGYPPPQTPPQWYRERMWLEEALLPALGPLALERAAGEVLEIRPAADGAVVVTVEGPDGQVAARVPFRWGSGGWTALPTRPS